MPLPFRYLLRKHGLSRTSHSLQGTRFDHHLPVEVLRVRLASPVDDAHPVATAPPAPGQVASESVAFGAPNGVKEPATLPPFTTMSAKLAAPVTLNAGGCVQLVGL